MGQAVPVFDDFDGLIVSPDLQEFVDRMQRDGLDDQAILARLAGEADNDDSEDFAVSAWHHPAGAGFWQGSKRALLSSGSPSVAALLMR
jgi:hypothetical protein